MTASRHPTAVIEDGASIPDSASIGPHAVIGPHVTLGEGVMVGAGVVITGHTTIGAGSKIYSGAVLGGPPQDFGYKDEPTLLDIGENCTVREHVTMHAGTAKGRGRTVVGRDGYFMVGCHVAHDCILGDGVTLSNNVLLAGHVQLGDYVLIGGGTAVLQRARIGSYTFVSGMSGIMRDCVPYAFSTGRVAWVESVNRVGLRRRGFDRDAIRTVTTAYDVLFHTPGMVFAERKEKLRAEMGGDPVVDPILAFIDAAPQRPYMQSRQESREDVAAEFLDNRR
ncbi:acyl-[acyl-carrier-protein]--UDP-N-acetylglucosamine O-acyltransferase [Acuticoccus sediminis]|uniref:Acyl-[acyl-carrier-protein]--UDP-N-acetylglucosamine O-acyltransferase n=1 Tax=Acuticoccus sediminis TaxID=2184697 RepID=A0A8B2NRS2_9HYPH|nr:acyl-ACP--UDP-N-acetylglucosamine O-acyltransferase [Acuticoccus sediminis]RAH99811.1 acyl-[acyl-carrier-protein]--UDP-N-acetylglucosamine O-acyltransferase [Acuticoccus sediminis]